jgi:hypothetical protein
MNDTIHNRDLLPFPPIPTPNPSFTLKIQSDSNQFKVIQTKNLNAVQL